MVDPLRQIFSYKDPVTRSLQTIIINWQQTALTEKRFSVCLQWDDYETEIQHLNSPLSGPTLIVSLSGGFFWETCLVSLRWFPSWSFSSRPCSADTRTLKVWKAVCTSPTLKCTAMPSNQRLSHSPSLKPGGWYSAGVTLKGEQEQMFSLCHPEKSL